MRRIGLYMLSFLMLFAFTAQAHFGMVIPDRALVVNQKETTVNLQLSFSHPMERNGMKLEKPAAFYVVTNGEKQDLLPGLKPAKVFGGEAWSSDFTASKPGVHQFVMEPNPYWEPAEDCYIIHYTKTFVSAFGEEEGWDEPLGLKTDFLERMQ